MEKRFQRLIVPWDFSHVSENALKYALKIGAFAPTFSIDLVHVLETGGIFSKGKLKEKDAVEQLKTEVARIKETYGLEVKAVTQEGSIFHAIRDYAFDTEADLVVMGTHGIKGVQKITGSWALKVIAGSNVPFLVIQDEPKRDQIFQNLILPQDFRLDDKERLSWAIKTATEFNSTVHMILPHVTDSGIQLKVNNNLAFAKKHFSTHNIKHEVHSASKGSSFSASVIKLAVDIEADLILIMTTPDLILTDYMFGAQEQYIIANNAKIAVMCINPAMV